MGKERALDTKESVKVVTSNSFITALELSKMSLKARKLLYVAIAQCKKNDEEFYEYKITIPEFAKLMKIQEAHVYQESFDITKELSKSEITYLPKGRKKYKHVPLMALCDYDESCLKIELNPRMTELLLKLKGDFTQALLTDFMTMRSPYSMAIWHLMQREMRGKKPGVTKSIDFYLSLEELRVVTGSENKFKKLSHFKDKILDKALLEIQESCGTVITYKNRKQGRTVVGFEFSAINEFGVALNKSSEDTIRRLEKKCDDLQKSFRE